VQVIKNTFQEAGSIALGSICQITWAVKLKPLHRKLFEVWWLRVGSIALASAEVKVRSVVDKYVE
jgi:hypothetical protein